MDIITYIAKRLLQETPQTVETFLSRLSVKTRDKVVAKMFDIYHESGVENESR